MAFREMRAWIALGTLVPVYALYFLLEPTGPILSLPGDMIERLGWFAAATVGWGLAYGALMAALALRTPGADRAAPDERDRLIAGQAASTAYYLLMGLMILVGIVMPFDKQGWDIVNAALLAIVLAEGVRHLRIILAYRRGRHG